MKYFFKHLDILTWTWVGILYLENNNKKEENHLNVDRGTINSQRIWNYKYKYFGYNKSKRETITLIYVYAMCV